MMRFRELPLPGAVVIEADPATDERGLFARLFDADLFRSHGLPTDFVQASASYNHRRGTLRGLHFQAAPHAETKLVRCTAGVAFDVIVDIRANSPQFGRWHAVEISALNRLTLIIPPGFAHGFETLADGTEIFYQMTHRHMPYAERGIAWNDPDIRIAWPISPAVMSVRDAALPPLASITPK